MAKIKEFTVRGRGRFPIDMLRYDSCWPLSQVDAGAIGNSWDNVHIGQEFIIKLQTESIHSPTVERWSSFGWPIYYGKDS